jgi:predicted P-loop ATPase
MSRQVQEMSKRYNRIVKDLDKAGLDFRINDLDESMEVKMNGSDWQIMDDTTLARAQMSLEELGYGVRGKRKPPLSSAQRAWTTLADSQRYNPIKDYFNSLDSHTKYIVRHYPEAMFPEPYTIKDFADAYFTNADGYLGKWLFRWMVGCIAKAFEQARNPILVVIGPQRMGKSRLARWLCPVPDRFREGSIEPDSKDGRLRLIDTFIQEVGELGGTTRRKDVEALKEHITKMFVHDRVPYARMPVLKPALCNFIGSVNYDGAGFLNDPTGSTRFLSCQIDSINFAYSQEVDVHELWAEAWYFYRNVPNAWELTPQEQYKQAQINAQFEMVNPLEDVVEQHCIITGNDDDYVPAIDIKNHLVPHFRAANDTIFYRELAKVLYKSGCVPGREPYIQGKPHRRAWYGLQLRGFEPDKVV